MGIVAERKALRAEIRERKRTVLPELRAQVKRGKAERKKRLKACQIETAARLRKVRKDAQAARKKLAAHIKRARTKAQQAVNLCTISARTDLDKIDKALEAIATERAAIKEMTAQAAAMVSPKGRAGGLRAAEKRAESDEEVIFNLNEDANLIDLFKKVRKKIKKTRLRSRTEAFLEYVHDNPQALDELRAKKEQAWEAEAAKMFAEREAPAAEDELIGCQAELARLKQAAKLTREVPF